MSPKDTRLIADRERTKVGDSLNLDEATKEAFPNANRWDYLMSVSHMGQIVGVEPHSAKDDEVSVVIRKKKQAIEFLRDHLPPQHRVAKWFWVSHGSVSFSRMDKVMRQLDQHGIAFHGHQLRSFDGTNK